MKIAFVFSFFSFFLAVSPLFAQDTATINSLLRQAKENAVIDLDKSILESNLAIAQSQKIHYTEGIFKGNLNLGYAYYYKHNYLESLELFVKICSEAEKAQNNEDLAFIYYFISKIHRHQGNMPLSIEYGHKSYQIALKINDLDKISDALSAIANAYGQTSYSDSTLLYLKKELAVLQELKDTITVARTYSNIGITYLGLGKVDSTEKYISKAVGILNQLNPVLVQKNRNAKKFKGSLIYELSNLAYLKNDLKRAETLALESYEILQKEKATREISKLAQLFSKIYKATGQHAKAMEFMELYAVTKDSMIREENSAKFAEMETRYETQKKEEQIKAQELLLEQERTTNRLYITILSLSLLALFLLMLFIRNRQQYQTQILLQKEKENTLNKILETEEKERARIAKDLHDGIVQDLTVVKLKIQSTEKQPDTEVKSELKNIYTEVDKISKELREISYQMMPVTLKELGLVAALEDLLNRLLSPQNIRFDFEAIGIETRLSEKIEVSIYRMCQELLNNSIKHSQASEISLLLLLKNNTLTLTYEDNGVGFDMSNVSKGIGLNSLDSRIKMIHGSLEINSAKNEGITAYIKIPI